MVYLVGGYKLTEDKARAWGKTHGIDPPEDNVMAMVNEWLEAAEIPASILACTHGGEDIFLFVTHRRNDVHATYKDFQHFQERARA